MDSGSRSRATVWERLESLLWVVVVGIGFTLVSIALWNLVASTSIATITAVFHSDTMQWLAVVAFGCVLILAASGNRSSDGRYW